LTTTHLAGGSNGDMRTNMIAAVVLLGSLAAFQAPALAGDNQRAELRLTIVDEANSPVANATVTVYTIHGPRTVNTNEKGAVVIADLPAELTQVWARTAGNLSGAEAGKLKAGVNKQTLTVHSVRSSESGS
jgi:hypothetical protein